MADVPLDVLDDFRPRYAGGGRARGDSAADLEGQAARVPACADADEPHSPSQVPCDDALLAALAAVAKRRGGRNGRLGLRDYAIIKQSQKGGFGRVAVAVVEDVPTSFALKTVRVRALCVRGCGAAPAAPLPCRAGASAGEARRGAALRRVGTRRRGAQAGRHRGSRTHPSATPLSR
jgi:hypothetical protein